MTVNASKQSGKVGTVTVVGTGLMGQGIALQFAVHGFKVYLNDTSTEILDKSIVTISDNLRLLSEMDMVDDSDMPAILDRITADISLEKSLNCSDLVIEAVYEDLNLKRRIFADLDELAPDHTIFASNTSSFMASQLVANLTAGDRVLVANWWNPPYLLPLVEVVPGPDTSQNSTDILCKLLKLAGKSPVVLQKESLGFIGNRLQFALLREAISLVESGVATAEDVDRVVTSSFGRRLAVAGPFEVFDIAGWDTILHIIDELFPHIESSTMSPETIRKMVETGDLGVKSGMGFYTWDEDKISDRRVQIAETLATLGRLGNEVNNK
jgi:3-hydroxybutyryl-CoA dehydrogenase